MSLFPFNLLSKCYRCNTASATQQALKFFAGANRPCHSILCNIYIYTSSCECGHLTHTTSCILIPHSHELIYIYTSLTRAHIYIYMSLHSGGTSPRTPRRAANCRYTFPPVYSSSANCRYTFPPLYSSFDFLAMRTCI